MGSPDLKTSVNYFLSLYNSWTFSIFLFLLQEHWRPQGPNPRPVNTNTKTAKGI